MNLLFSMSLAGSLVFILYLIINPITKRYLPASWRYRFLKVSLLFYLLPYQYYKYHYMRILRYFLPKWQQNTDSQPININRILLIDSERHIHFKNQSLILTIFGIWGVISLAFLLYHTIEYVHCMRNLQQITKLPVTISDELHISKRLSKVKVSFCTSQYINVPFTVGVFSPHVILPVSLADEEKSKMVIAHEMVHIRNHDNLVKFLWLLSVLLHWYNPLVYLLYKEICNVSEQVCDALVIQNLSEQEKEQYKLLIIELGQKKTSGKILLASKFSSRYKMIKERITAMDRTPISSKRLLFITSLAMILIILTLSPVSVSAYSPAPTLEYPSQEIILSDELYALPDQNIFPNVNDPFYEYGTTHDIFISADGQTFIIECTDPQVERVTCPHDWQDGMLYTHVKNNDGSCTMNYYDCQYCTLCQSRKNVVFKNTLTYAICPH